MVDASVLLQSQLWCGEVAKTTRVGVVVPVGVKLDITTKTSHSKPTCMFIVDDAGAFRTTPALRGQFSWVKPRVCAKTVVHMRVAGTVRGQVGHYN